MPVVVRIPVKDRDRLLTAVDDKVLAIVAIGDAAANKAVRISPREQVELTGRFGGRLLILDVTQPPRGPQSFGVQS